MYNSAVFETLSTHEYDAYIVSKDFTSGVAFENSDQASGNFPFEHYVPRLKSLRDSNLDVPLKNLTARDCILIYGNAFATSKYKDVLTVSSINNATNSLLYIWPNGRQDLSQQLYLWFCEDYEHGVGYCDVEKTANHAQNLTVAGYPIDYCLAQEVDEKCMLQFSLPVMFIVIICNLIKVACMICVLLWEESQPLMTMDDAIASFLNEPDFATKKICLTDKVFFRKEGWQAKPLTWKFKRHR